MCSKISRILLSSSLALSMAVMASCKPDAKTERQRLVVPSGNLFVDGKYYGSAIGTSSCGPDYDPAVSCIDLSGEQVSFIVVTDDGNQKWHITRMKDSSRDQIHIAYHDGVVEDASSRISKLEIVPK